MDNLRINTPVCFFIFKRPDTTQRVFERIRQAQPPKLLVIADGPRTEAAGELEKCQAGRAIIKQVDWDCEVLTNYSETNLGCRKRISSGLDWVFNQVEEAIILEDDCLPDITFFRFCEELLEKYRHHEQIMAIAGDNFQYNQQKTPYRYYFSRYAHSWGWATWKRSWQHYDREMKLWPQVKAENCLQDILEDDLAIRCWSNVFQQVYDERLDTWDYPWQLSCWIRRGLTILPNINLVSNIGFEAEGTHTKGKNPLANLPTKMMSFPLKHPPFILRNTQADNFTEKQLFSGQIQATDPNHAPLNLIEEGVNKLNENQNGEALTLFQEAIAQYPDVPHLNYGKALALARLGYPRQAVDSLKSLLDIVPSHKKAQLLLGELRAGTVGQLMEQATAALQSGQVNEAFHWLNQAKSCKQPIIGLDYLRAACFLQMNQPAAALEALYEELRYFPNNLEAKECRQELISAYPELVTGTIEDAEFQALYQRIRPYTMLSEARLYSLFSLVKQICLANISGNIVECGVAGGGSTALMAAVIQRYSKQQRYLYAFDSFEGMPLPTDADQFNQIPADATGWGTGTCAAPESSVREICTQLGVWQIVQTVKGYFEHTLPTVRNAIGMIAFLHMDGDWYESTKNILDNLYDRVVNHGVIQVDDYGHWSGCRQAIHEFESQRQIHFDIKPIDSTGVWFSCPDKFPLNPILEPDLVQEFYQDDPVAHDIESQMSQNERFQLYYILRKLLPEISAPLRFVEIGSYAGSSLFLTCRTLDRMAVDFHGFTVEPGGTPAFYELLPKLADRVTHLREFSHQAVSELAQIFESDGNFPLFIFIDGDHSYQGVRQDILDYFPLLAPGGIMAFHDYLPAMNDENREGILFHHGDKEPGIRQACEEIMENIYGCEAIDIFLLYPTDPTQTQAHLPIIPGVFSTIRVYRKSTNKPVGD